MLDIRTLYLAQFAVILTAGTVMLLSRRFQPDARSVGIWGGAAITLGIGMLLAANRDVLPLWIGVLIANGLIEASTVMIWNGARVFNGRAVRWPISIALVLANIAAMGVFLYGYNSMSLRIVAATLLLSAGLLAGAYELARWTDPALRRLSWAASASLVIVAISQLSRGVDAITGAPVTSLFASSLTNQIAAVVSIVIIALLMFCLAMMANIRLQLRLAERSAELEQIAHDRDYAGRRAEEANRAKSTFLAMMSHELRTPLNAILGFSELGPVIDRATPPSDRIKEYFGLIHQSGTHLLRLINDILDLSKIEAGKMELDRENIDLDDAIKGALRVIAQQATERSQTLAVAIADPQPRLYADERAVRQILFNLLSNAVRFTPERGTVRVEATAAEGGGANLIVADTGVGIPPDEIARLKIPFEQLNNSYTRSHGGTGLGLPLVDALVRLHGGSLDIESEVGVGTRVTAHFPPAPV